MPLATLQPSAGVSVEPDRDDLLMLRLLSPLFLQWRKILATTFGIVGLATAVTLVWPRSYTATESFVPQAPQGSEGVGGALSSLAGLAGQFGISIGSGGEGTPDFFAALLTSREIMTDVLQEHFVDPDDSSAHPTLLTILDAGGSTPARRLGEGLRYLGKHLDVDVDHNAGVVTLSITLHSPVLAAQVASRLVAIVDSFSLDRLQAASHAERMFSEGRLAQAKGELSNAEDSLLRFLTANRRYADSPLLSFENDRLQRQVQLRLDVLLTLQHEYEQARIEEVRNTPVLTIVDHAVPPDKKSSPHLLLNALVAMILGATIAIVRAYWRTASDQARANNWSSYETFTASRKRMLAEMRGLLPRWAKGKSDR